MTALLEIRNLAAGQLGGVSLSVGRGEIVALLGANGAGKSTLLGAVVGEIAAPPGAVLFEGRDLAGLPPHRRARLGIGYCPAGRRVFPGMTVDDNLEVACFADAAERARRKHDVAALFPQLAALGSVPAWRLSGGQQQMLAIARALMARPSLLLLDEPSLGLAPLLVDELLARLRLVAEAGTAVLLAEQNIGAALGVATRAMLLVQGRVAAGGTPAELRKAPDLARLAIGLAT
ncbi:MAG: ABC transporter ATP-binding protein [Alphaproteobacteria bacterium]|nr:ABC transporter ATP-binding protein [Alphaproteobacteria bacterium]